MLYTVVRVVKTCSYNKKKLIWKYMKLEVKVKFKGLLCDTGKILLQVILDICPETTLL